MTERPEQRDQASPEASGGLAVCEDVRSVLFEYMTHELGDARSVFVREHLRRCAACRAEAADIKATLAALHAADDGAAPPARLSEDHRERLLRAVMHPVLDWIDRHHRLVAALVAVIVILSVLFTVRNAALFRVVEPEPGIPIWKIFRSGVLPELVERERQRARDAAAAENAGGAVDASSATNAP